MFLLLKSLRDTGGRRHEDNGTPAETPAQTPEPPGDKLPPGGVEAGQVFLLLLLQTVTVRKADL